VIVIGIGNELRRDDGAGPAVIDELQGRSLEDVTLAVSDGEPSRLIDLWAGEDQAIIVDALPSSSGEPGRVRELDSVGGVPSSTSSHALGLGIASRLGGALDRLPATMRIFIIEGGDFGFGVGLCSPVARAVMDVADRIARLTRDARS
jgi:hydrogenase maturation protease